jgi:cerevisin
MKLAALSLLTVAATATPFVRIGTVHHDAAPVLSTQNSKAIPNSYIVKFKKHVRHHEANAHHEWINQLHFSTENQKLELRKRSSIPLVGQVFTGLKHTYNIANDFLGYSGHFSDEVIEQLRRHPDVSTRHPDPVSAAYPSSFHLASRHLHSDSYRTSS